MDLTFPPVVEHAARTAREFVEAHLLPTAESGRRAPDRPRVLSDLASLVAESPLAHFAVFRELGRAPLPWARIFMGAGLPFHDLSRLGGAAHQAGLISLALGDPRRTPDPSTLTVGAMASRSHDATWVLEGVALAPGYLAPVDSLLVGARVEEGRQGHEGPEAAAFLVRLAASVEPSSMDADLVRVVMDGTPALMVERGEAAWELLRALRRHERLSQIALAVGAAGYAHESSLSAAREATAAKDALALGQGIQFQVADNAIDLQVAETLALHCATLADTGALTDADLSLTRFVVLEAFERVSRRAAHIAGLFAPTPPEWTRFFLDLARRLRLEGGAVELDRREAALGVLQNV